MFHVVATLTSTSAETWSSYIECVVPRKVRSIKLWMSGDDVPYHKGHRPILLPRPDGVREGNPQASITNLPSDASITPYHKFPRRLVRESAEGENLHPCAESQGSFALSQTQPRDFPGTQWAPNGACHCGGHSAPASFRNTCNERTAHLIFEKKSFERAGGLGNGQWQTPWNHRPRDRPDS